jgi:predicted DNA-binding transcriptional regulator YafY
MELFSEIYSCYYSVTSKILRSAPISKEQLHLLVTEKAFSESALYLIPKLYPNGSWGLLSENNGLFYSKLKASTALPLTLLEKRWLKSLLEDPRIRLFLDNDTISELSQKLSEIKPLYSTQHFKLFDMFNNGDDYSDPKYIHHFKTILRAINEHRIVSIAFSSGKGKAITADYVPYRLEYSQKNDKFRIYAARVKGNKTVELSTINLSRIQSLVETDTIHTTAVDMAKIFEWKRCKEPILLEISSERNGIERFMMEFASYEKRTEWDELGGKCTASLWYDKQDETEILIRLLSFGPILKVIGPNNVVDQMQQRIDHQFNLLFPTETQNNIETAAIDLQ